MANCFLTGSFGGDECDFGYGGVERVAALAKEQLGVITYNTTKTAIVTLPTLNSAKFHEIFVTEETAGYDDDFTRAGTNKFMTQVLNFAVSGKGEATLARAHELLKGKHSFLIKCNDGFWRLMGSQKGMIATQGKASSGVKAEDEAGLTFSLTCKNLGYAPIVPAEVAEALIGSAVAI